MLVCACSGVSHAARALPIVSGCMALASCAHSMTVAAGSGAEALACRADVPGACKSHLDAALCIAV